MTTPDRYSLEWLKTNTHPDDIDNMIQEISNDPDVIEFTVDPDTGIPKVTKRKWDSNRRRKKKAGTSREEITR